MYKRLKCKAQIYKTPRRKHTVKFIYIYFGCNFFDTTSNAQITEAKSKKKKTGLHQIKKFLHSKRNKQQNGDLQNERKY